MEACSTLWEIVESFCPWIPRKVESLASTSMSRDFWMPDHSCPLCYECDSQFTIFNRRHHCRICGRVFCGKCTQNTLPASSDEIQHFQIEEGERVRVCNFCYKHREQGGAVDSTPSSTPTSSGRCITTADFEEGDLIMPLITTQKSMAGGATNRQPGPDAALEFSSDKKTRGSEVGLMANGNVSPRGSEQPRNSYGFRSNRNDDEHNDCQKDHEQRRLYGMHEHQREDDEDDCAIELEQDASDIGEKSQSSNSQSSISQQQSDDGGEGIVRADTADSNGSSEGLEEVVDDVSYETPLYPVEEVKAADYENNGLVWIPPVEDGDDVGSSLADDDDDDGWGLPQSPGSVSNSDAKRGDVAPSKDHRKAMQAVLDGHFRALVAQLLVSESIEVGEVGDVEGWLEIVSVISLQAASLVKPDTSKEGGMDPGGYVKVKCVSSGKRSDSVVVKGVVCRKTVAHKRMRTSYRNARILLLGGALEYQRISNQWSSLDTLLQQEKDHLSMTVARIEAIHHPDVILVEKSVSRFAQDSLLNKDITVVLNVKRSLLDRIARCIGAQVVTSLDNLGTPMARKCELFHVEKYVEEHVIPGQGGKSTVKSLMFFEGCPRPLGCTILLRGATSDELKKVKQVIKYAVFAAYQLALETSFFVDEGATLPQLPCKSPISVSLPNKLTRSDRSISSIPSVTTLAPVQNQVNDSQPPQSMGSNRCMSPVPVQVQRNTTMGGTASTWVNSENGALANQRVPLSASSSCVSSANNSPGTSPAQTTFGFQSFGSRSGTSSTSSSVAPQQNSNGIVPGSHSWQGISGLSASLKRVSKGVNVNVSNGVSLPSSTSPKCIGSEADSASDDQVIAERHKRNKHLQIQVGGRQEQYFSANDDFPPSPSDHQRIVVSFSSRSLTKGTICCKPHVLRIQYYGTGDKALGRYLTESLFDTNYRCRNCDEPADAHVHCYIHRQGSLTISVRRLKPEMALPREEKIWMWHRCLMCPLVNGVPPATRKVVMSAAAAGLSFGKFLELSFSKYEAESRVAVCGHSLHRDCLRFYGSGRVIACFRYEPINLLSVHLPPAQLEFNNLQQQEWLQHEIKELAGKGTLVFFEVMDTLRVMGEKLATSRSLYASSKTLDARRQIVALEGLLQKEKTRFEEAVQKAQDLNYPVGQRMIDILELNLIRRELVMWANQWDSHLQRLAKSLNLRKLATTSDPVVLDESPLSFLKDPSGGISKGKVTENQEIEADANAFESVGSHLLRFLSTGEYSVASTAGLNSLEQVSLEVESAGKKSIEGKLQSQVSGVTDQVNVLSKAEEIIDANGLGFRLEDSSYTEGQSSGDTPLKDGKVHLESTRTMSVDQEKSPRKISTSPRPLGDHDPKILVNHSLQELCSPGALENTSHVLDGEFGVQRTLSEGHYPIMADLSQSLDSAWTGEGNSVNAHTVDLPDVSSGEVENPIVHHGEGERSTEEGAAVAHSTIEAVAHQPPTSNGKEGSGIELQTSVPSSPAAKWNDGFDDLVEGWIGAPVFNFYKSHNRSLQNVLSSSGLNSGPSLISPRAGQIAAEGGARVLLPLGNDDVVVAVYDDEPTTIIAYAISSQDHIAHVQDTVMEKDKSKDKELDKEAVDNPTKEERIWHPLQPTDGSGDSGDLAMQDSVDPSILSTRDACIDDPLISTEPVHVKVNFTDENPQGKVKFSVTCYFAKQFDALRKKCCTGNLDFIRSMSRCRKWGAPGGKSNVFFAKTADDRLVVKQVTRTELNSFLGFAPSYFKYLCESLNSGSMTCLAKILGVFEVKQTKGGKETKIDVLVMENLLYGRRITRLYDLKGSLRSRYNADSTGNNKVLLDENLVEAMPTAPIFVGKKAKWLLERAVWNDTHFLADVYVMDYSLLVGVVEDSPQQELVVGIIDFIRQYTWDKHLETWVKASGILGGPKNAPPTVISPNHYKKRFRKAMTTYFLVVPEWTPSQTIAPSVEKTDERHIFNGCINKEDDNGEDPGTSKI